MSHHPSDRDGDGRDVDSYVAATSGDRSSPSSSMWLTAEETSPSVGGGSVYVTVDTSQALFPDVSSIVVASRHLSADADSEAYAATDKRMTSLRFDATSTPLAPLATGQTDGEVPLTIALGGTKLETLAHAATSQLSLENATVIVTSSRSDGLLPGIAEAATTSSFSVFMCGECSYSFASVEDFFQHWLEHHCQPQMPAEAESPSSALSVVERCFKCNRIFVSGTPKCAEHAISCVGSSVATTDADTLVAAVDAEEGRGIAAKRKLSDDEESGSEHLAVVAAPSQVKPVKKSPGCVSCGICSSNVRTVTSFFLHWLDNHRHIAEILEEVWQCGRCTPHTLFPSRQGLKDHVAEEHVAAQAADAADTAFACPANSCDVSYGSAEELERHCGLHAEQPFAECAVCGGFFADPVDHARTEHESRCDLCACSAALDGMATHLANNHKFVQVWNRNESLQKVVVKDRENENNSTTPSTSFPSDDRTVKEKKVATTSSNAATTSTSSSSTSGSRCKACPLYFTSEKLLEKHYYANHEFQCKFCDLKMDKDLYGDHLRLHLATERKKGVGSSMNAKKHVQ